ncbi:MAG TPA: (d)CMP kinase [Chitinophagales bacterium]|jgi:cytidylate kinase|nr:(d)CMP kinase [Chitinophagales bacterium]MBP6154446.1 (d)CMP kinase [Chitinophagales bacterium]HQV77655.1 (d)CMP kinase [Chitinophagales bacterium]HQW78128.1 (d)CMP kinase [Chitinophagales bacterium]HRB66977.1 (d)CMP kinase [Chitinophagales bacterium]
MKHKINIAIDGYSACGKSSTAKRVANTLGYIYIDSGAMYRAVTLYLQQHLIDLDNKEAIENALPKISIEFRKVDEKYHTFLNNEDVELEIREPRVAAIVSEVAAMSNVRKKLVEQQQKMATHKGLVMEGRDIGSVVMPNAELKFFMTADIDIRTQRRQAELLKKTGKLFSLDELKANLLHRDRIDSTREDSPLTKVKDAIEIDTTHLTLETQIQKIVDMANAYL